MLTNLVDGSDAESVTVAVLQWLNLHLQMLGEDEGDEKDDKDNEDIDAEDDKEKDKNGNDNNEEDEKPFYPRAGLPQLGASRCPESGPVPRSGIWSSFLDCFVLENN